MDFPSKIFSNKSDENNNFDWIQRGLSDYSKYQKRNSNKIPRWPIELLRMNEETITQLKYFPCGLFLAFSTESLIKIWNLVIKKEEFSLDHDSDVINFQVSPNGMFIASLVINSLIIWNLQERSKEFALKILGYTIKTLSYTPNGQYLAILSDGKVIIFNIRKKTQDFLLDNHRNKIFCISFSPENDFFATGCYKGNGIVTIWNFKKKMKEFSLPGTESSVTSLCFCPKGNLLASAYFKNIKIWDFYKRIEIYNIGEIEDFTRKVLFTPNGKFILSTCNDCLIRFWNIEDKCFEEKKEYQYIKCFDISPNSRCLAIGSCFNKIKICNLENEWQEHCLNGHFESISDLNFSNDGKFLATLSNQEEIKIWNIKLKSEYFCLKKRLKTIKCISFTPNSKYLVFGDKYSMRFWSMNDKSIHFYLKSNLYLITCMSFNSDDKHLAVGYQDGTINIWDYKQKSLKFSIKGHSKDIKCLSFSADFQFCATGSKDKIIRIWNFRLKKEEFSLNGHTGGVLCLSFSSSGQFLATGSKDHSIKIWDLIARSEIYTLNGHSRKVSCLAFCADGKTLITCSWDTKIKFWDLETRLERFSIDEGRQPIESLAISPNNKYLATSTVVRVLKVWNIQERRQDFKSKYINNNSENFFIISSSRGLFSVIKLSDWDMVVYDFLQKKECFQISGHSTNQSCLSFSYDEKFLASVSRMNVVHIWNIEDKTRKILNWNLSSIIYLSFSFDRYSITAGCKNKTIRKWSFKANKEVLVIQETHNISSVIYSPDENFLAIKTEYKNLNIWNLYKKCSIFNIQRFVETCSFTPDCQLLVTAHLNREIKTWDFRKKMIFFVLKCELYDVTKELRFDDGGKYLWCISRSQSKRILFLDKLLYILHKSLKDCIRQIQNLEDLYRDALVAVNIYNYFSGYSKCKLLVKHQFIDIVSKLVLDFSITRCPYIASNLSKNILNFARLGFRLCFLNLEAGKVLNDHYLERKMRKKMSGFFDMQVLHFLMNSIEEKNIKKEIKLHINQLCEINKKKFKEMAGVNSWTCKRVLNNDLPVNICYSIVIEQLFNVLYVKSSFHRESVLIKEYFINMSANFEEKIKIRKMIEKEAKFYKFLSENQSSLTFACEYLGYMKSENSFSIVVKEHGVPLIEYIKYYSNFQEKGKIFLSTNQIRLLVCSLLQLFTILTSLDIYHRWITPFSLRIDEFLSIKITDFTFSHKITRNSQHKGDQFLLPHYNQQYRSPEEEIVDPDLNFEKCDVYSLGLVILQLVSLRSIYEIKENLEFFLEKIVNQYDWLSNLLRNMLSFDPNNRLSFKELRQLVVDN